ncbi:unnamed protein product [Strongylus vulgaris]|uniref:Uncharacterized protein n=1 Tax=Strongylus vulgaris TaxID=40348 RepID=A0A3P7L7E6_STRVU|nr:unnamed protein product [Strongylus vulgaris]
MHNAFVNSSFALGFRLLTVSPQNSYTRKNVGYLYAIKNGAKWIYDTDDDNKPYGGTFLGRGLSQFDFTNTTSGLCYRRRAEGSDTQQKLFNPYRFFGNPAMWPRGFPLEHLRMFRLLHADKKSGLNERFNEFAPPVVLSPGISCAWKHYHCMNNTDFSNA